MNKANINIILERLVEEALETLDHGLPILREQEEEASGADDLGELDAAIEDTPDDVGGDDLGDTGGDLGADSAAGGAAEGDEGDDFDMDDSGGGAGFSGGGFSGGGGGFSGGDDFGDDADDEDADAPEESDAGDEMPTDEELNIPEDPAQTTIDLAVSLLDETGDDNKILSAVKGSIQAYYEDWEEAVPVIQGLWETQHPILRVVARKLLLFIRGK